jgi:hypothetical protein
MMPSPSARKKLNEDEIEFISRERPYVLFVMQTQMLYDIASMLEETIERLMNIERLLAKPRGYIYSINRVVDRLTVIDFTKEYPRSPLFAITLFNDGPNDVYVSINEYQKVTPLKPKDSISVDMRCPVIEVLYLDVDEGKKTSIRGFGTY